MRRAISRTWPLGYWTKVVGESDCRNRQKQHRTGRGWYSVPSVSTGACRPFRGLMFYAKPSSAAAACVDAAILSLPADSAPHQPDSAPNPVWNDETMAEAARAGPPPEAAWPSNHLAADIQIDAEQADSEQTADESSIGAPTTAPAHLWAKPLAVLAPGGSRSAARQRNTDRRLPGGAARLASRSPYAPIGGRRSAASF